MFLTNFHTGVSQILSGIEWRDAAQLRYFLNLPSAAKLGCQCSSILVCYLPHYWMYLPLTQSLKYFLVCCILLLVIL